MRRFMIFLLWLPLVAHAEEVYWFNQLVESAAQHVAPTAVQSVMAGAEKDRLLECQTERKISNAQIHEYFSAIPIDLNGDSITDYLVFPSIYCFTYFGMHSTEFWLLLGQPNGEFKRVLVGRQDGLEVLASRHGGLRDVKLRYGNESELYHFGGKKYRPVKK